MKTVRLSDNKVLEVIPDYALPVEKWYGTDFAAQCMEAPDEVKFGWVYDPETDTFSEPSPEEDEPETPTLEQQVETLTASNKLLKAQLQAQTERSDFIEDCIAEMAVQVYGGV